MEYLEMGSNDHDPTGSASLKPKWGSRPKEVLYWSNVSPQVIVDIVSNASKVGAYVGFGQSADQTALLLYVKNGRVNERVALESYAEASSFGAWVSNTWLNEPR